MSEPGSTSRVGRCAGGRGGDTGASGTTTGRVRLWARFRADFNGTDSLMASVWLVVLVFPAFLLVMSDASLFRKITGVVLDRKSVV